MHLANKIGGRTTAFFEKIKKSTAVLLVMLMLVAAIPQGYISARSASTNETLVFRYLVDVMGLNTAAACGVLANIEYESNFNPTRVGDNGTSYGICQWHYSRKTNLMKYCETNGLDYTSLEGQLSFLDYELKKSYKGIYNYLKSVSNDAQGAYNAGYYWCYHFEIPLNYGRVSVFRGNLARNTYWPAYRNGGAAAQPVSMDPRDYKVSFSRVLKYTGGSLMNGTDVKYVQVCLRHLGYQIDVDGYYGSGTSSVVKKFQKDSGLTADGICGSSTWNALVKAVTVEGGSLSITTQPTDCTAKLGGTVSFTVKAAGEGLTYQWQLSDDAGKTWRDSTVKTANYAATLTKDNIDRKVRCVVKDKNGKKVTSAAASMKLLDAEITKQPVDAGAALGETVIFKLTAVGSNLTYQWQLSDDGGKTWRNSSVKTSYYAVTVTEENDGRCLRCIVIDKNGGQVISNTVTMKATSGVKPANTTLAITSQPVNCNAKIGGEVSFTVKASGTGLTYQWQLSDDAGKTWRSSAVTTNRYVTTMSDVKNGRYVRCIVTDKNGKTVTSKSAVMRAA